MKFIAVLALALTAVVYTSAADTCTTNCNRYCTLFKTACNLNPFLPFFGVNCGAVNAGCEATCGTVFCPCLADAMGVCGDNRAACRTGGAVDVFCQFEFDGCVVTQTGQCFGQVGVTVMTGILQTLGSVLPMPPMGGAAPAAAPAASA